MLGSPYPASFFSVVYAASFRYNTDPYSFKACACGTYSPPCDMITHQIICHFPVSVFRRHCYVAEVPPKQGTSHSLSQHPSSIIHHLQSMTHLCHHRAGRRALVLPVWLQHTNGLVISAETMDSGFNENEAELGILVLAVALEMLADGDGLENIIRSANSLLDGRFWPRTFQGSPS